jgi:hypothetical protein
MAFRYEHLDGIIERVTAVEEWYSDVYENSGSAETMGDVYEQKMDNLRGFIMEDQRSDWIAKDAWFIEKHFIWYVTSPFLAILNLLSCSLGLWLIIRGHSEKQE